MRISLRILAFVLSAISLTKEVKSQEKTAADSSQATTSQPGILLFVFEPGLKYIYREALEIGMTNGTDTIVVEGISLFSDEREALPHSDGINTPSHGTLHLWFSFSSPIGDTISSGELELSANGGYVWRIVFTAANRNPTRFCADCIGYQAFPIADGFRQNDSDSIWIYWAGSARDNKGILER